MVNFNELIGLPIENAIKVLNLNKIAYKIEEHPSKLENYDTILVVQTKQEEDYIILITDKFLLNI